MTQKTLYDKLWETHVVRENEDGTSLIYIDRHLVHEVTSPQAFEGLRIATRVPWRTDANLAVADHNVPTDSPASAITDPVSRLQVETLDRNCREFGIYEIPLDDVRQGIVHIIGPEQGATLPGMTIVCGDSHTATHGAIGALAFGIGTSEVEHVLATQCLVASKSSNMRIVVTGSLRDGVGPKDVILAIIARIGTAGATGHAIEYCGNVIRDMSIEGRFTVCNMSIEAGARAGMVAVDDKTIEYLEGRPMAPQGEMWTRAVKSWRHLVSDPNARFDQQLSLEVSDLVPQVTWGTSPEMVIGINDAVPDPENAADAQQRDGIERALAYMNLKPGMNAGEIEIDRVFIGSCTNGRIEDLRQAAAMLDGRKVSSRVSQVMVVPGSGLVRRQAEDEGLHEIFMAAGCEWRTPGCSMCLAMNADRLLPGERCASTSNRNFEGRQGRGGRTHLVSPAMAAAAAVEGRFVDISRR